MRPGIIFCAVFAVLVHAGTACTVLEDRSACPARLHLDLSDISNQSCDSLKLYIGSSRFSMARTIGRDSYSSDYVVEIPDRGGVCLNVYDNRIASYVDGGTFTIPEGRQCPEAFMFSAFADTSEEENDAYVKLHKNYCGVSLLFTADNAGEYDLYVYGDVCGYSESGQPSEGRFLYRPGILDGSSCFFRLPRQKDASLRMGISAGGENERFFALGNYIEESGYDWTKEDLDDVVIKINYAQTILTITINDWTVREEMSVII